MKEQRTRQTLAENLRRHMDSNLSLDSPEKLAKRCFWPAGNKKGKTVSPRNIRYVLKFDGPMDPHSPSLDLIIALANTFKVQPWELLVDDDTARRWIMARILVGKPVGDDRVEAMLQEPPAKPGTESSTIHPGRRKTRKTI